MTCHCRLGILSILLIAFLLSACISCGNEDPRDVVDDAIDLELDQHDDGDDTDAPGPTPPFVCEVCTCPLGVVGYCAEQLQHCDELCGVATMAAEMNSLEALASCYCVCPGGAFLPSFEICVPETCVDLCAQPYSAPSHVSALASLTQWVSDPTGKASAVLVVGPALLSPHVSTSGSASHFGGGPLPGVSPTTVSSSTP